MSKKSKKNLTSPINPQSQLQPLKREVHQTQIESFSGPLPKPSILKEYNDVVPGAAERILNMAEKQAEHRQFLEKTVIIGDSKRAFYGLWAGVGVAVSVLGGAVFLIFTGHDFAGAVVAGLDITGLVSAFIYGTVSRRSERTQKTALMNPQTKR
ncbi:MAG: Protein of unknown function DUF2335, rane [Dehalococcoidia bacterium]|nr:Protein of unknown function DUF2335, rane [Dehalococcoidia bacterium]